MEAPARPSRKLQEHGERYASNSSPVHIHCSRDSVDYTAQTFINCGYAGILRPNITVKMGSPRGRPRRHAANLRHLFTTPQPEFHNSIDDQFSAQQQISSTKQHLCDIWANPASQSGMSIKTNLPLAHHHRFGCCWPPALSAIPALSLYRRR